MPVFDVAGAVQTPPPYWQRRALRRQMNAQADLAEQQAAGYQDEVAIERSKADTAQGNLRARINESVAKADEAEVRAIRDASAAALSAEQDGKDPQKAFVAAARLGGIDIPNDFPFDSEAASAYVMTADEYLQRTRGNEESFAKINPKDFTPESVKNFQETGDYSSLDRAPAQSTAKRSTNDILLPILDKLQNGEDLTPGEQKILDVLKPSDPMDSLLRVMIGDFTVPTDGGEDESVSASYSDQDVLALIVDEVGDMPPGDKRNELIANMIREAKSGLDGISLTARDVEMFLLGRSP